VTLKAIWDGRPKASRAALCHRLDGRFQPREIDEIIKSLEDSRFIEVESVKPGKKGGRPGQIYTEIKK
jgi:hypothetical protein